MSAVLKQTSPVLSLSLRVSLHCRSTETAVSLSRSSLHRHPLSAGYKPSHSLLHDFRYSGRSEERRWACLYINLGGCFDLPQSSVSVSLRLIRLLPLPRGLHPWVDLHFFSFSGFWFWSYWAQSCLWQLLFFSLLFCSRNCCLRT